MTDLTVKDLLSTLEQIESKQDKVINSLSMWHIGKCYFIRTVTMHSVGRLIALTDDELMLEDASWVADSGRFNNALKTGELDEVEPFVNNVIINRKSVIDATVWDHKLPKEVK